MRDQQVLVDRIIQRTNEGYKLISQTETTAMMRMPAMTVGQHIVHILISLVTAGLWLVIYIPLLLIGSALKRGRYLQVVGGELYETKVR